jgi:hypothetical protein
MWNESWWRCECVDPPTKVMRSGYLICFVGVEMLLDLLEVCPPLMQFQVLGCLADLMENRKVNRTVEERKTEKMNILNFVLDIPNSKRMVQ